MFISNDCATCEIIRWHEQDVNALCPECLDEREAKAIADAFIVKDSADIVESKKPMSYIQEEISGHEWISSTTRKADGSIREEFTEPTAFLVDRFFELKDGELDIQPHMTICAGCHLEVHQEITCPNCELVNN